MGKAELKGNLMKIYIAYVFILLLASAGLYLVLTLGSKDVAVDLLFSNRGLNQTIVNEMNTWFPEEKLKIKTVDKIDDDTMVFTFQNKDKENVWISYKSYKRNGEVGEYEYYGSSSILSTMYIRNKKEIEDIATKYNLTVSFEEEKDEYGDFGHTKIVLKAPYDKVENTHKFAMDVLKIEDIAKMYNVYCNSNELKIPQNIIIDKSQIIIDGDDSNEGFTYSIFNDYNYRMNVK